MKKQILGFALLATLINFATIPKLIAQPLNCDQFKNGTFKMDYNGRVAIVKRSGNIQTESILNTNIVINYHVKWIDKCTYTLTPTEEDFAKMPAMPKNTVLTVKIIKTSRNSYTQVTTANISKKSITGELVKI